MSSASHLAARPAASFGRRDGAHWQRLAVLGTSALVSLGILGGLVRLFL